MGRGMQSSCYLSYMAHNQCLQFMGSDAKLPTDCVVMCRKKATACLWALKRAVKSARRIDGIRYDMPVLCKNEF